jgi:cardiolipin synthase
MKKSGIKIRVSHPFRWRAPKGYKYRNHKKLIIIDGTVAITGGFNIANEYHGFFGKHKNVWRDMGIYLKGSVVVTLLDMFRKSWITWRGEGINYAPPDVSASNGIPVIPLFASSGRARRKLRRLFIYSIRNARESIHLTTAYFIPGNRIIRAMKQAARRGVDVRLLLPGKTDVISVFYAGRRFFTQLLKAGVKIYTYQESVLHSKTVVFDRNWCIIGSANLDFQSLRRNEESNVGILDRQFGIQMTEVFHSDVIKSTGIDLRSWQRRPLHQTLLEIFFHFIMRKL